MRIALLDENNIVSNLIEAEEPYLSQLKKKWAYADNYDFVEIGEPLPSPNPKPPEPDTGDISGVQAQLDDLSEAFDALLEVLI